MSRVKARSHGIDSWFRVGGAVSVMVMACWAPGLILAGNAQPPRVEDSTALQGPEVPNAGREPTPLRISEKSPSSLSEDAPFRLTWETRPGRSYLIPALEIPAYLFLLNLYDRHFTEPRELYRTNWNTFRTHLTDSKWVIDDDQFSVNQFLHPYSGTVYYGLARSAGLNFWESLAYAGAGSFLWELGGEKTLPSIN
ncbi:MAG TPA: DUF3943 domain-containing protein, partial [Nitrospira sp.]|nr:DUF3943 domain-containing protein [Nitrospira sp.]